MIEIVLPNPTGNEILGEDYMRVILSSILWEKKEKKTVTFRRTRTERTFTARLTTIYSSAITVKLLPLTIIEDGKNTKLTRIVISRRRLHGDRPLALNAIQGHWAFRTETTTASGTRTKVASSWNVSASRKVSDQRSTRHKRSKIDSTSGCKQCPAPSCPNQAKCPKVVNNDYSNYTACAQLKVKFHGTSWIGAKMKNIFETFNYYWKNLGFL